MLLKGGLNITRPRQVCHPKGHSRYTRHVAIAATHQFAAEQKYVTSGRKANVSPARVEDPVNKKEAFTTNNASLTRR